MTTTAAAAVSRMQGMLGMVEHPAGSNHNDVTVWFNQHVCAIGDGAWCQMTVDKALSDAGYPLSKVEDTVPARWMAWTVGVALGAEKRGQWHWGTAGLRAGDVVYYNWSSPYGASRSIGTVDHTGMVERVVDSSHRYIIEGNIGDACRRELRDGKYIVGYWRPAYDSPPSPAPGKLTEDGQLGPKTVAAWQRVMRTPVDGVIDQPPKHSQLVAAVQKALNGHGAHLTVDGQGIAQDGRKWHTVAALQHYLGTPVDGVLSKPTSRCVGALQHRLNSGRF